ncbi:MAG TPA: beta-ketoacyl synthase N-terminal-like domain-containing protein, partial [Chloroflexota bacterium]|nr:beta-ketoacyl synthase N-terminal-like domain-containing protein [Chloroflexota bacterium]
MAAIMPEARTLREFWSNIVEGRDCMTDVPASRWSIDDYYDPDPSAPDKTYCKRGGFIPDVAFDPVEFGLPPNILEVTDVHQLLALVLARRALEDAGYDGANARAFDRERTGVVLGIGGGQKLVTPLTSRLQYPIWKRALLSSGVSEADADRVVEKIKLAYVPWEENSFPGLLGNVIAGRVANRLDLGGINCVVDAACASSLSALKMALSELTERRCDMMLTGGIDTDNSPFMYMSFSKTPAFSRGERLRPFDEASDGMLLGEGLGMMVLKRLEDAERDGDRIYAVVKGIGTASDGRFKSIYAPRSEGQARALRRAYENAGIEPETVGLIEAHGTGTVAGDRVEATTLVEVLGGGDSGERKGTIALGSVKSQIGHTKSAAGAAGMIKAALALHHKVLPPTINVTRPHPEFGLEGSPVYLNTRTRPWMAGEAPRRAGVSSFGFGGTNYHVVLEEHTREAHGEYRLHATARAMVLAAPSPDGLIERGRWVLASLEGDGADAAWRAACAEWAIGPVPTGYARLGLAAGSADEARALLATALERLPTGKAAVWEHPKGMWYRAAGMELKGKVAALFPGQGSQYVEMGRELASNRPEVREAFAVVDKLFARDGRAPLSRVVYPAPAFDDEGRAAQAVALQRTENAQPAIGALSTALYRVLERAGFEADVVAGHSFGELTALWAAGALDDETYFELARARGAAMAPPADPDFDAGTMVSVQASVERVNEGLAALEGVGEVRVANVNSPRQVVIAGPRKAVGDAGAALEAQGLRVTPLPVSAAFHTPLVGHAQAAFEAAVERAAISAPTRPVYANATGEAHPADAEAIRTALVGHILQPVQFQREVERLYEAGARLFVEVGPRSVLTNLVGEILGDRAHVAVALNASRQKDSDRQVVEALVRLKVLGLALDLSDRYAAPEAVGLGRRLSGAAVMLNGANFVSEKTRGAYAAALADGHRIGAATAAAERAEAPATAPPIARVVVPTSEPAPPAVATPVATPAPTRLPIDSLTETLTVIESGLSAFGQQQSDALRAHQQYLEQQAEQSRTFLQLIQQQQELLLSPAGASVSREAHETLARSLALYQELQVETARAHQAYLQQHAEHARLFASVLGAQGAGVAVSVPAVAALPPRPVAFSAPAAPAAPAPVSVLGAAAPAAPAAPVMQAPVEAPAPAVAPAPVVPA